MKKTKSKLPKYGWGGAGKGALSGAAAGASVGSVFPGVGTLIGAGVGALAGGIAGHYSEEKEEDLMKEAEAQNAVLGREQRYVNDVNTQGIPTGNSPLQMYAGGGMAGEPVKNVDIAGMFGSYKGQKHSGPNEGIPVDSNSVPSVISGLNPIALVEGNEFVYNNKIFSHKLGYADKARKIRAKYNKRIKDDNPNSDKLAVSSLNRELDGLFYEQEIAKQRASNEASEALPKFDEGGTNTDPAKKLIYKNTAPWNSSKPPLPSYYEEPLGQSATTTTNNTQGGSTTTTPAATTDIDVTGLADIFAKGEEIYKTANKTPGGDPDPGGGPNPDPGGGTTPTPNKRPGFIIPTPTGKTVPGGDPDPNPEETTPSGIPPEDTPYKVPWGQLVGAAYNLGSGLFEKPQTMPQRTISPVRARQYTANERLRQIDSTEAAMTNSTQGSMLGTITAGLAADKMRAQTIEDNRNRNEQERARVEAINVDVDKFNAGMGRQADMFNLQAQDAKNAMIGQGLSDIGTFAALDANRRNDMAMADSYANALKYNADKSYDINKQWIDQANQPQKLVVGDSSITEVSLQSQNNSGKPVKATTDGQAITPNASTETSTATQGETVATGSANATTAVTNETATEVAKLADKFESSGNPNAKNPTSGSSSEGPHGFINRTWLDVAKKFPEYKDMPEEELLKLKTNPEVSTKFAEALALDNGRILQAAGIDPNKTNLYLAHHFGAGGAKKILKSDDAAPLNTVFSDKVIADNPYLKKFKTVGELRKYWGDQIK